MYTILLEIWGYIKGMKPAFMSKSPHFNFMTIHYFYIIGLAFTGSICLYIRGGIKYIDALFLASGSATQSGLNTIDINLLNTWQQLALYFGSMLGNPITINSFVVFLRLYWFEKEFMEVATKALKNRRTFVKTFTKSRTEDRDLAREEHGVGGRSIVVMHGGASAEGSLNNKKSGESDSQLNTVNGAASQDDGNRSSNDISEDTSDERCSTSGDRSPHDNSAHHTQIKFAERVKRSNGMADEILRVPIPRSEEEHIAILQRQRNPSDSAVLRIPGPRDADAGVAPEEVDAEDVVLSQTLSRRESAFNSLHEQPSAAQTIIEHNLPPPKRNITIQEPHRPSSPTRHIAEDAVAAKHAFSSFSFGNWLHRKHSKVITGERVPTEKSDSHRGRKRTNTLNSLKHALSREKEEDAPYLSWQPTVGRNSIFVDLTEEQREELGGIEYRSLKSLAMILVAYFWGFSIFAVVSLVPWILESKTYGPAVTEVGQGRVWWGIFTANSGFTDLGYTLTPNSMIPFQTAVWPLLLMSFLIIIGNTGFPIMLRIIIWVTSKWVPRGSGIYEELKFLLDHPRRCFTLLFPSKATWWLFWILVILNGVDMIFFIILDLGNTVVTELPTHVRVLDGYFQAISTRTAGFGVVDLSQLHPAIQVSYLVMMYISVLPIAISVRRTNVYEEKSLGLYGSPEEEDAEANGSKEPSYVGSHLRRQLSFDLWYIFLGFFIIAIAEGPKLHHDPGFSMFSVLFEIVSAYGTVGLSLGYPGTNASLSAQFSVISKLVIIAMQIRGRHRGLPYALDKAILLPSEQLERAEAEEAALRARRRNSFATDGATPISRFPSMAVSSGAVKVRSMSRSSRAQAHNILSDLLHIGPPMPDSHRNLRKFDDNEQRNRRASTASTPVRGRMARSVSPSHMAGDYGASFNGNTRKRQTSGRRHFYEDGINEPPAAINET